MIRCTTFVYAALLILSLQPGTSIAATLLDQPPSLEFGIFSDEGFDAFLLDPNRGYSQSIAENFRVQTSGVGFLVEQVVIWGAFDPYMGSALPLWDDVDVLVHADDNGLPGTVLCSQENVWAIRTATGVSLGDPPNDLDQYMVTLTLGQPCGLSDGDYWLEVYYNTTIGYDDWFWQFGALDVVNGLPYIAYAKENPGQVWEMVNSNPIYETAVQVNGTPGHVFCVDDSTELQAALTAAGISGADDVIQVVQNLYPTPGSAFFYTTSLNNDLQLLGGFTADCSDRALNPANTILDGGASNAVLAMAPATASSGDILIQGFTVQNGFTPDTTTAGLEVGDAAGYAGVVTITHNAILDNHSTDGAGGLVAVSDNGFLRVINNLIAGNSSGSSRGAGLLSCSGETIWMTNNTVADNSCTECLGGIEVGGSTAPAISNNILWGNDSLDLVFSYPGAYLRHNDIGNYSGFMDPASPGNLFLDPLFQGAGNYRLQFLSPVLNQGTADLALGLSATDLDGNARVSFGQVDIGAYELPLIFYSGFESPDLGDWSLVVNGG